MNFEGQQAPAIELNNQDGKKVTLDDFKGKYVVLYFYPKDDTPGCTTQACDFRDNLDTFGDLNAVILGVSPDDEKSHNKFIEKFDIPYDLLVDTEKEAAKAYDVWRLRKMFGKEFMGIERSTFIIDPEGKVVKQWRKVQAKGHFEKVLEQLRELQNA
ncbi:thioredoxin-dependent thiol peroxidase [Planococcaceae bacterium Storch 2/2-2]|nr:thioredoxin-dependent thiol peroxidase [Planococcaceae bacterium Storch 2/2-2]